MAIIRRRRQQNSRGILYNETKELLLRQLAVVEAVDAKASIVAGLDGLIIGAALGLLGSAQALLASAARVFQPWFVPAIAALGTACGLASAAFALLGAFWPRTYTETIKPRKAYEKQYRAPEDATKLQWLHNFIVAHEDNTKIIERKALALKIALILLVTSFAIWAFLGTTLIVVTQPLSGPSPTLAPVPTAAPAATGAAAP